MLLCVFPTPAQPALRAAWSVHPSPCSLDPKRGPPCKTYLTCPSPQGLTQSSLTQSDTLFFHLLESLRFKFPSV